VLFAIVVEVLLILGMQTDLVVMALSILLAPPLGMLLSIAFAVLVGALAVYLLKRLHSQILISTEVLWALVFCVMVQLVLKSLLPLPLYLIGADQASLIGVTLGVFWQGRSYWRR